MLALASPFPGNAGAAAKGAAPLGMLALLLWPEVGGYWGLSGLVHAAIAVLAALALQALARERAP